MAQKVVYTLYDDNGCFAGGPYIGEPELNFSTLADSFRKERYAKAEADREDYCIIFEHDFVFWLLEKGILSPMDSTSVTVTLDTQGDNRYIPAHWPLCPVCEEGRGEETTGRVLHPLNRQDWHRQCTNCGHTWDHHDEPYQSGKPMLADDGRCIASGCVPYSISQAGGLPMTEVLAVCTKHGWSEANGMYDAHGILAAKELGLHMQLRQPETVDGRLTLRKLLGMLSPAKSYIVSTRNHWLAVVKGESRDQANTSMRAEVAGYWEVAFLPAAVPQSNS